MKKSLTVVVFLFGFSTDGNTQPSFDQSAFDQWDIAEVFSNSDGTIQYIELFTSVNLATGLGGHTLTSSGPTSPELAIVFDRDLFGTTSNRTVLIATERFANLTELTPDYTIPTGFVPFGGGTLSFADGADVLNFEESQLPLNGVQSIDGNAQTKSADPMRFDGLSAQVPTQANPYANFDAGTSILNVPILEAPGIGIGNVDFLVDLETPEFTLFDFYLYSGSITPGDTPVELRNGTDLYFPDLRAETTSYEANLNLVNDDPIVFGEPDVLNVSEVLLDPDPDPTLGLLEASIASGQVIFQGTCDTCHRYGGAGGYGPSLIDSSLNTFDLLRVKIDEDMPANLPSVCRDTEFSTCVTDTANFVLHVLQDN